MKDAKRNSLRKETRYSCHIQPTDEWNGSLIQNIIILLYSLTKKKVQYSITSNRFWFNSYVFYNRLI
jgi:hypothetical protein